MRKFLEKHRDGGYLEPVQDEELAIKLKANGEEQSEYDEAVVTTADERNARFTSNLDNEIHDLQEVLQYTSDCSRATRKQMIRDAIFAASAKPSVEAEVSSPKINFSNETKWKQYHMFIYDNVLVLKKAKNDKLAFADPISYVEAESLAKPTKELSERSQRVMETYLGYLEKNSAQFCLKVYTPRKIFLFKVDSEAIRDQIVQTVRESLQKVFLDDLWIAKSKAAAQLEPLRREQFVRDLEKEQTLIKSIAAVGMVSDSSSILRTTSKDKCGVLKMFQHSDIVDLEEQKGSSENQHKWAEYYFVLSHDVLYYFKHSTDSVPAGFISLDFAAVDIDRVALQNGSYVFTVRTPLRTITLKTKHAVALSSWISALERSIMHCAHKRGHALTENNVEADGENGDGGKALQRRDSHDILAEIQDLQSPVSSLSLILKNNDGVIVFREFLQTKGALNALDCLKEMRPIWKLERSKRAGALALLSKKYLDPTSPTYLSKLDDDVMKSVRDGDFSSGSLDLLKDVYHKLVASLDSEFEEFKDTDQCDQFVARVRGAIHDEEDQKQQFEVGDQVLAFEIEVRGKDGKGRSKRKVFRLDMAKNIATIGRDHANDIVVEDEKVSRAHGKFEYGRNFCKYLDQGSSHGSKVNGDSKNTADLALGDSVKIGHTTLKLVLVDQKFFKKMLESIRAGKAEV